jgi:hypothetical protein
MTRPRGFIASWRPQEKTRQLLEEVGQVFATYARQRPLTIRQVYYVLVGRGHEKTDAAYQRLGHHLGMARRAGLIPFDYVRDDGADIPALSGYYEGDLVPILRWHIEQFEVDPQHGQPRRIVLWCEAAGMRPQLERVAALFGVPVIAGGGFDSLTAKHDVARQMADSGQEFEVLHIGDLDDHGEDIFTLPVRGRAGVGERAGRPARLVPPACRNS